MRVQGFKEGSKRVHLNLKRKGFTPPLYIRGVNLLNPNYKIEKGSYNHGMVR